MTDPKLEKISINRYTWTNCTGNVEVTPDRFFYPRDRDDISLIVKEAERSGRRVRAVGSGHSFSEAAKGKDFLLSMKFMSGVRETPRDTLKKNAAVDALKLVDVEAGTIIKRLNIELDQMGLGLKNMGAVDVQTISGAVMTGTHGSGFNKPAMQDMVKSVRLVGKGGEFYQIEPTAGITDPALHKEGSSGKLIQDDELFYSTIVSFGGMGIIYEVTLEVVPEYWMWEKRILKSWSELKEEILADGFLDMLEEKPFWSFRVNPYKVKGKHLCAVVEQYIYENEERPRGFLALRRNLLASLGSSLEYLIEAAIERSKKRPKSAEKTINFGLRLTKDLSFHAKSHKVLYQGGQAVLRYGIDSEFAFKAEPEKLVSVIERVFAEARKIADETGLYHSSFISIRFTDESQAYLSSAYKQKTVYIDIPTLYGTTGDTELLERYQKMMIGLGGIPHWGKYNNQLYQRNDFIREKFEKVDTWIAQRERMDPDGTFLNDFIINMGLSNANHNQRRAPGFQADQN